MSIYRARLRNTSNAVEYAFLDEWLTFGLDWTGLDPVGQRLSTLRL